MDVRAYKCPLPRPVFWPGTSSTIGLRALPQSEIDEAEQCAKLAFLSRELEPSGPHFELERALQILSCAADFPVDELSCLANPTEIKLLYDEWERIQFKSRPVQSELSGEIKRALLTDSGVIWDGIRAAHCKIPSDFYGRPINQLTDGQLAYFLVLKDEHQEMNSSSGTKYVSKECLNRNSEKQ